MLRLTPFKFEDFCAVLQINESSQLLAEIHISLMKIILKSKDTVTLGLLKKCCN